MASSSSSSRRCLQLAVRSCSRRTLSTNPNPNPSPNLSDKVDTSQYLQKVPPNQFNDEIKASMELERKRSEIRNAAMRSSRDKLFAQINANRELRKRMHHEEIEKVRATFRTQFAELKSFFTKIWVGVILSISAGFGLHFLSLKRGA